MAKSDLKRSKTTTFDNNTQIKIAFGGDDQEKIKYNMKFQNNRISTTKYNIITWLPKSLLMQFRRIANVYFLIISILTCFNFSPKNPVTMIGTFAIVLIFTMLKEAFEDVKRYKQDREVNTKIVSFYNFAEGKYEDKIWETIRVGDIVAVNKEDDIAADLLLIKSSLDTGLCFVDTMNLDGETNLKEKMAPPGTREMTYEMILRSSGKIICDKPNENLEKWECSLTFKDSSEQIICTMKQLLLKGCKLKNTDKVLGVVVYTGHNTKIMKNAKQPPMKMSNLMRMMNKLLYSVFAFQICLCFLFSMSSRYWINNQGKDLWYLPLTNDSYFIQFLTFLVAYSTLIPISLYVALELVKMIQSLLIYYDVHITDPITKKPALARTSDLIEELGQVEFIFSDKTGTLTKNEMEFRKCFVNLKIYGEVLNGSQNCISNSSKINSREKNTINGDSRPYHILSSNENSKDKEGFIDFFRVCSVCHSAYVEDKEGVKSYQSSSPDEVALLEGAAQIGFEFVKKTSDTIETLNFNKDYTIWELIMELPFDSTRKRMSVIVKPKNSNDSNYYLFTKGADTAMLPNIPMTDNVLTQVKCALDKFANEGLRTLVLAKKVLKESEVKDYKDRFSTISLSADKDKEQKLVSLFHEIETKLEYVGSSAIEDKLQDGVADTIELLMNADIRVWVLTGDKKETAVEIGKSCKLILREDVMDEIDLASPSDKDDNLDQFTMKLDTAYRRHVDKINQSGSCLSQNRDESKTKSTLFEKKLYMIIDGKNLAYVLNDPQLSKKFFKVGLLANSVVCCRVSPKQKSQVVKLAKQNGSWITLSIGDGANDVPMIMEAHIGVGISGKEGTQAVRSADYAIAQFQFLRRLVLVHGRWGYRRIAYFICYYFYKNIVIVFTELYFALYNGFSGQSFFPDLLPLCYNAFWTSWPCIFAYSIERDVDEETSLKFPILYKAGQTKFYFSLKKFWIWILFAIIHGVIIFYGVKFGIIDVLNADGMYPSHWLFSTLCFSCLIHIVTFKIFVELLYWNYISV